MLLVAVVTGAMLFVRPAPPKRDLEYWVFAASQVTVFRQPGPSNAPSLVETWNAESDRKVQVKQISVRAADVRLLSLMMSNATGEQVPDLVSLEIGSVGKYFRFPAKEVGLLPLDDFLDRSGWRSRILSSRFAPWTRGGKVFGIPYDIHPTAITYRKDLYDQAGVDLATCKTWPEFQVAALAYQKYWAANGHPERIAIELSDSNSEWLGALILQRHVNLVDSNLESHLTDPRVLDTLVHYAQMVAGPGQIGANSSPGPQAWVNEFTTGDLGAFLTPDWRVNYLRLYASKELYGKLAMMPLPRFDPSDARTSTRGGTMVGIPRNAPNPELSWKLIEHFYLNPAAVERRLQVIDIIPPVIDAWSNEKFARPDPLYNGQKTGAMLVELAHEVPEFNATPFTGQAASLLSSALQAQVRLVLSGADESSQREYARKQLAEADEYLRRSIRFSAFD